eukprot:COSAG04_NODE_15545_length_528_cov_1.256410_1_plen_23_part_10
MIARQIADEVMTKPTSGGGGGGG